ncbi:MAG: Ig-like domain-containing protein [Acidobacteria bacterium]|nr:Ig-like domain-containing protein [Acidobacteriota bacterium]
MRLLLASLLLASAAYGQASIQILSDATQVLVGRTLQFRAIVRDAQGNPIPNGGVTWSTNNVAFASIDSFGVLTARSLGTVRVQARSGSLFSEAAIQTIPSRVEISPQRVTLEVGKQQRFSATAFDANGTAIPGVGFAWSVLNYRLGTSQVARIDTAGMLSGVSEGGAMVLGTYSYGDVQTGLQRQWVVTAPIDVQVPKSYELRRIYSRDRDWKSEFEIRAKPTMIWPSDDGTFFFNASLDGVANGLVNFDYNAGTYKIVSTGGQNRFVIGSYTTEFRAHSITRTGRVLSYEDTNINGAQINVGDKEGVYNHLSNNTPLLAGTEATSGMVLTRNSFNDAGYMLLRANFRFENNTTGYTGLFLGNEGRYSDILVNTSETLPGITGAFTIDGDFGVDGKGTAVYSVTAGANRVFFRHTFGASRTRLIGIGDALLGSTVRSFAGGRGNHPAFWIDEDGTVALCVVLNNNNTYFVRWLPDGKLESLQVTSQSGILWHHPLHGTLLHTNPFNNKGNGIWLWPPAGDPKPLIRYTNDKVDGETIQDVESGAINTRGEFFAYLRGDRSNMMLVQLGLDQPRIVLRSGDRAAIRAPHNIVNFIGGARSGRPHVYSGGSSGSIVEISADGPRTVMPYGERLWGNNTMWFGASHGGTWNVRKSPQGDIYFTTGSGLARINGDGPPELILRFPLRVGAITVNAPGTVDVNSRGDMLYTASTSAGDSRIYLHPAGAAEPKELLIYSATAATASTLDGRIASGYDSFAFNDEGRVLISLRFRNVTIPILYTYDGANWKEIAVPNTTRVGPHLINGIANLHRAGGGKLFAGLNIPNGTILCEWAGDHWEIIVNNSTIMPSGQVATTVVTQESNRNGDLLFQHSNGGNNFLIVRRGEKMYQVVNLFRPTAEGDYFQRINSIDFRDDGTVYFLAGTVDDDLVLYEARPLF